MRTSSAIGLTGLALLVVALAACGSNGTRKPDPSKNGPALVPEEYETTKVGHRYLGDKIKVKEIDRSGLADGTVRITIKNRTDEYLADLAYQVTLYYKNTSPDPAKRASIPYTPQTTDTKRIDLDAKEEAVLTVPPGVLGRDAKDVLLRLRKDRPAATRVKDTYLSDRVKVVDIDRDWFAKPPKVTFKLRNEWEGPIRLQYKVLLIKDGAVVNETEWRNAPRILEPGQTMDLERVFTNINIVGALPALKVKRPRI